MNSGSFARGGQPRSVPDPSGDAYDEMLRRHGAIAKERRASMAARPPAHPPQPTHGPVTGLDHVVASAAHVLDGPRRARRELEQGHMARALVDGATSALDLAVLGNGVRGILRGELKLKGPFAWRTKPWETGRGAREWMGDKGIVQRGQHAHHALIPNNGWGKFIPDAIKNQPANIKPMENSLTHTRIHSASRKAGLPRFNPLERYWHGTPTWWKVANGSGVAHAAQAVEVPSRHESHPAKPRRPAGG